MSLVASPPPPPRVAPPIASDSTRGGTTLPHAHGFWDVAFAFMVAMASSAVPAPLYGPYAARAGFGSLTVTFVFAA